MSTAGEAWMAFLFGMLIGTVIGYCCNIVAANSPAIKKWFHRVTGNRIKIIRYWVGDDNFNISLMKIKMHEELHDKFRNTKVIEQATHLQDVVKTIVGSIIAYDLKEFEYLDEMVQHQIDIFVDNYERFNEYLKKPEVALNDSFYEAAYELKEANQPVLNTLGNIKDIIIEYVDQGHYKVINFKGGTIDMGKVRQKTAHFDT